jgi:quinol monooxygenase YgiN
MITRIVKLTLTPSRFLEFKELYIEAQKTIRTFEGCHELGLFSDVQQPNVVFTLSKWQSEKDLNHYRYSEFFKGIWTTVKPMFAAKAEAWSLCEVVD